MTNKYLDIFVREADEHLAALQKGLLTLERETANAQLIHELLRNAHTLKGSARMLGFEDISAVAHRMEDLIKAMEEGDRPVDSLGIDLLLQGTDAITRMKTALARGEESPVNLEKFLAAFDRGESPREAFKESSEEVAEVLGDTVRARVSTLDSLVNLVGELIISKKRFEDKVVSLKTLCHDAGESIMVSSVRDFQRNLEDDVLYLSYLIQELHGEALSLRMMPLRTITESFQRLVRDVAKAQGKEVKLELIGDSIEVDRVLIESLKPMFLHMITNAVDHGLETAEERQAAGKPAQGTIRISARHEGSNVRIDIRDDGRGMNPARIKEIAVRRGLIDSEEADLMSNDEALYLTMRPGFSTSEIVTDISGRGVGMDVVQKNVERVKGTVTLKSEPGNFTEVTLVLPLTLSVIEALMVSCCGDCYTLPLTYVQEIIKVRHDDIKTVGGKEVVVLRGVTTPLVSLATMLGLPEQKSLLQVGKMTAVVLRLREQTLACTIDRSLGSSEIVVKGLGGQLKKVQFVFGATILGDGSPALILNVPDIFSSAEGGNTSGFRKLLEESEEVTHRGKILVVDDSITTRTMERSILITHGYYVDIAVSGEDALEKVERELYDLVISDVEMPGINGFELTRRLRSLPAYEDVPVVIVSSLARDEDKRQAIDAGAQAYIVKGTFDQGTLLDTVEALIG